MLIDQWFPARRGAFPCTYTRLPLHHSRLKAIQFQPLVDKMGARLAGWWDELHEGGKSSSMHIGALIYGHLPFGSFQIAKMDFEDDREA